MKLESLETNLLVVVDKVLRKLFCIKLNLLNVYIFLWSTKYMQCYI